MSAPSLDTTIIACPSCRTRYRVPRAVVAKGRKVACANCDFSWTPDAGGDALFDEADERELDAGFEAAEKQAGKGATGADGDSSSAIASVIAPKPQPETETAEDATQARKRQRAFWARQAQLANHLPMGRMRRAARVAALVVLIFVFGVGLAFRTEIVRTFPDLAGLYSAIGLNINVVGLEFRDVRTLKMLRDGREVLVVNARIVSVAARPMAVPPVVVALIDGDGTAVFQWRFTPPVRDLEPGESVEVETQLTGPPAGAMRARLSFATSRAAIAEARPATREPAG